MNNLNEDLTDRYVILSKDYWKPTEKWDAHLLQRVFLCQGGFGVSPDTIGRAVFGEFVYDGESTRANGEEIERFATETEIRKAKRASAMMDK